MRPDGFFVLILWLIVGLFSGVLTGAVGVYVFFMRDGQWAALGIALVIAGMGIGGISACAVLL
jgi:hypothetical protein